MMSVDVYLVFDGNCKEAVEFYADVFRTEKPKIMTFGDTPPHPDHPLPEEAKKLVMHTRLSIDGTNVMFSDNFPGMPFIEGNNVTLAIVNKDSENLKSWFEQLSVDGKVTMPLQETFWSKLYGQVTDKFGIHWQLNLESDEMNSF